MIRTALERGVDFVTEHNRITLLVMVIMTGVVVAGVTMIDTSSQAGGTADQFQDVEQVQKANYIQDNYDQNRTDQTNRTFEMVYVSTEDDNVLSKESLLAGLRYQQDIRENESIQASLHEDGITGLSNLVALRAAGDRNASLDAQVRALENTSAADVERLVSQTLSEDPRAQRFLPAEFDTNSTTTTDRRILVAFDTETDDNTTAAATSALYDNAKEYEQQGFFAITSEAFDEYNSHFFDQMIELVLPIALLLILVILGFAYRDLVDIVVGMTGVVLSVLWMFGLLGWLGVSAGNISIVPVILITGLSIDFGFHVFNRYREQRGDEEGIRNPMGRGMSLVATALILVTVTAAIGFMANVANPLPVIRDLGISITLGVISAFVIFMTAVPALKISIDGLLERVGFDRRKQALGKGKRLAPVLRRSVTLARKGAPYVLVIALVIGAAGGVAWMGLDEESYQQSDGEVAEWKQSLPDPVGWETDPFFEKYNHVRDVYQPASADGAQQSRILIEDDVTSDGTLEDIHAGTQNISEQGLLLDQPGAQSIRSPVTAMQAVAQQNESFAAAFREADSDGNGVPDRNLASLYDAFYAANSDVAGQVIERTDGEYRSVLVTLYLDADYAEAETVVGQLEDGAAMMEGGDTRTATVAGSLAVNEAILGELVGGIILTMAIALLAILVTLAIIFRVMHGSASLGAVIAVPIALVIGMVIGGMYLLEIPLTLLTALLMSLVVGLGVDYNIHIGDRFADEIRDGKTTFEALDAAVTGTGGALLGSTLTTAGAFATITLVPQALLQSFGTITVIALLTSFLTSVLVLPSLLVLWSRYVPGTVTTTPEPENAIPQD
jgi:predicted RND superfamily exporter protein